MVLNNLNSRIASYHLTTSRGKSKKNFEKLASGFKINRSGDDAAGLGISEKMRAQITGLNKSEQNVRDGVSLIQAADGAMNEIHAILQRLKELTAQASNDIYQDSERETLQQEVDQLTDQIDTIVNSATFNNKQILAGPDSIGNDDKFIFKIGSEQMDILEVEIPDMRRGSIGIETLSVLDGEAAAESMGKIDQAINAVSKERGRMGAYHNRLEHTLNNIGSSKEDIQSAESLIRDVDMAAEMMKNIKNNFLVESGQFVLAHSNQQSSEVLNLLN